MNFKKVRQWLESFNGPTSTTSTEEWEKIRAQEKEETIQTITGCLLDGSGFGFAPEKLLQESYDLYGRVLAGEAGLDMDWMAGRKEYPTSREPNQLTSLGRAEAARRDAALKVEEHGESLDEEDELEWEH